MKQKPAILRGPYPTVEDTARLMGVSERRLKELLRLVGSNESLAAKKSRGVLRDDKGSEAGLQRVVTKKRNASASRKRRKRGKTAQAHA